LPKRIAAIQENKGTHGIWSVSAQAITHGRQLKFSAAEVLDASARNKLCIIAGDAPIALPISPLFIARFPKRSAIPSWIAVTKTRDTAKIVASRSAIACGGSRVSFRSDISVPPFNAVS
jgi:hypothetical protein